VKETNRFYQQDDERRIYIYADRFQSKDSPTPTVTIYAHWWGDSASVDLTAEQVRQFIKELEWLIED
jgi:hypothetical protein